MEIIELDQYTLLPNLHQNPVSIHLLARLQVVAAICPHQGLENDESLGHWETGDTCFGVTMAVPADPVNPETYCLRSSHSARYSEL